MKNKIGYLLMVFSLLFFILPVQGTDYATFESFYSTGGSGNMEWPLIIVGSLIVAGISFVSIGGATAVIPTWLSSIGTWIGSTVGLTGTAAANYGLALLSGGAIAAGGLCVFGGTSVLSQTLEFGVDSNISYEYSIASEKWNDSSFIAANKEMISLPVPRNEKGGKVFKETIRFLINNYKGDKLISDSDNNRILMDAIEQLKNNKNNEEEEDQEIYILRNHVLLSLLYLQTNNYSLALETASEAMKQADTIDEKKTLPSFVFALATISTPEKECNQEVLQALRNSYLNEPNNTLMPIMTACCLDRLMYRYHYGQLSLDFLKNYFDVITDISLNEKLAAESLNIFITRSLIELKRTRHDFFIMSKKNDVIEDIGMRYNGYSSLIEMLQKDVLPRMPRLSKQFPKNTAITTKRLTSLLNSYYDDLSDLRSQIHYTPPVPRQETTNTQPQQWPNYQQRTPQYQQWPNNQLGTPQYQWPNYQQGTQQQNPWPNYQQGTPQYQWPNYQQGSQQQNQQGNNSQTQDINSLIENQNNPSVLLKLGDNYYNGEGGVQQNYELAFKCYQRATLFNNEIALYKVGLCYYYGRGIKQDKNEAKDYFKKSAEMEYSEAQYALGYIYYYGESYEGQNIRKARELLQKAAGQGYSLAIDFLRTRPF